MIFEVTMERSAYRVVTLKIEAADEDAAETIALNNIEQPFELLPIGMLRHDETYDDTESSWTVNETVEGESNG